MKSSRASTIFGTGAAGIFAGLLYASPASAGSSEQTYLFGVVPQQSATRLARIWVPVMDHISKKTGLTVKFATTKNIPTFESCLAQGAYEFAYMNPYHYTIFHDRAGYQAFAHQADKKLRGFLVVRKDSPAQSLKDLNGKSFAFPSPAAFGASVLPRAEMRKNSIEHQPKYVSSHDSVYRSVAAGLHAAGGGVVRTFNSAPKALRDQLRVIYKTDAYTPHAFAALKTMPAENVAAVLDALSSLKTEKPNLLKGLGMSGFEAAGNSTWDDVRSLKLSQGATEIVKEGNSVCRSG